MAIKRVRRRGPRQMALPKIGRKRGYTTTSHLAHSNATQDKQRDRDATTTTSITTTSTTTTTTTTV